MSAPGIPSQGKDQIVALVQQAFIHLPPQEQVGIANYFKMKVHIITNAIFRAATIEIMNRRDGAENIDRNSLNNAIWTKINDFTFRFDLTVIYGLHIMWIQLVV